MPQFPNTLDTDNEIGSWHACPADCGLEAPTKWELFKHYLDNHAWYIPFNTGYAVNTTIRARTKPNTE